MQFKWLNIRSNNLYQFFLSELDSSKINGVWIDGEKVV
jgi:hypothetical protein